MCDRVEGDDLAKEGEAGIAFGCGGEVGKGRVPAGNSVSQDLARRPWGDLRPGKY